MHYWKDGQYGQEWRGVGGGRGALTQAPMYILYSLHIDVNSWLDHIHARLLTRVWQTHHSCVVLYSRISKCHSNLFFMKINLSVIIKVVHVPALKETIAIDSFTYFFYSHVTSIKGNNYKAHKTYNMYSLCKINYINLS